MSISRDWKTGSNQVPKAITYPLRRYKNEQLTSKHAWPILLGYAIDLAQFCLTVTSLKRCMGVCRECNRDELRCSVSGAGQAQFVFETHPSILPCG